MSKAMNLDMNTSFSAAGSAVEAFRSAGSLETYFKNVTNSGLVVFWNEVLADDAKAPLKKFSSRAAAMTRITKAVAALAEETPAPAPAPAPDFFSRPPQGFLNRAE